MEPAGTGASNTAESVPGLASKELVKKQSLELMRQLQKKNNPAQPFITVFGEGEDQMVLLNKSIDIPTESGKPLQVRLMITSTGVLALETHASAGGGDYLNGMFGVRAARKEGYTTNATIKTEEGTVGGGKRNFLLISTERRSDNNAKPEETMDESIRRPLFEMERPVPILQMDFQDGEKIQQAIRESYQEAKDTNRPKIELLTGLNDFAKTLGENPSAIPQSPAGSSPTTQI